MYQATNILDEINFDILEYAYLTTRTPHSAQSFDLWIPKLVAPLPFGDKKSWNESIVSPFQNSNECKVTPAKSLTLQNYITVERHVDTDFESRADIEKKLSVGQGFVVTLMNHDPRDMQILKIL